MGSIGRGNQKGEEKTMNTEDSKKKYTKHPHYAGKKTRMNESLDAKIVNLQNALASGTIKEKGGKVRKLESVDRDKINYRINQTEKEIIRINRV
jgi:hypothetical protein